MYRPVVENAAADTLSRVCGSMSEEDGLRKLHDDLCHPGITRMIHFVRSRNLPYSVEDIKKMTASCSTCAELKPRFHKPTASHLIKATQPFERLSLDFKGPLPSGMASSCTHVVCRVRVCMEVCQSTSAYVTVNACLPVPHSNRIALSCVAGMHATFVLNKALKGLSFLKIITTTNDIFYRPSERIRCYNSVQYWIFTSTLGLWIEIRAFDWWHSPGAKFCRSMRSLSKILQCILRFQK